MSPDTRRCSTRPAQVAKAAPITQSTLQIATARAEAVWLEGAPAARIGEETGPAGAIVGDFSMNELRVGKLTISG